MGKELVKMILIEFLNVFIELKKLDQEIKVGQD